MRRKIESAVRNPAFSRIMLSLLGAETVTFFFVKARGGSLEHYLALFLPMLAVTALALIFSFYHKTSFKFPVFCILLLYMGIAMQCIIQNESSSYAVKEQIIFLASVAAAGIMIFTHYKWLSIWKPEKILVSAVLATVMIYLVLLILGTDAQGTRAWITFGAFSIQPTEFIKILFVYVNTMIFCCMEWKDWMKLLVSGGYLGINLLFSVGISEMGSFLLMLLVYGVFCILFLKSWRFLLGLLVSFAGVGITGAGIGAGILWYANGRADISAFLQKCCSMVIKIQSRITIWLHPENDPLGTGYQGMKAREAMALGGWFGSDYPVKIPVEDSDYIFTSILLHMGLAVGILMVLLFLALLVEGIKLYLGAESGKNTGIVVGCVYYLFAESMLMILGSTGFFLMTGVPIAFVSNGGTALMAAFMMAALILYLGCGSTDHRRFGKKANGKEERERYGEEKVIREN
nr:FtsW/RodA/SpoVE family cell cycle protein [uncultured Blautia sp.]